MQRRSVFRALLCVCATWCVFVSAAGQSDTLREECRKRDLWCSRRTFVWDVAVEVTWRLNRAERAMLESASGNIPVHRQLEGHLVVSRTPSLTYMGYAQLRSTLPEQVGRFEYWFGKGFVVVLSQASSAPNAPPSALVLPAPADALYVGAPLPPSRDELAWLLHPSFVAGADPFRVFAPASVLQWRRGKWSVGKERGDLVAVHLADVPGVNAEFHLSAARRFAPAFFRSEVGPFQLEYTVEEWQRVDGWWLPHRIEIKQTAISDSRSIRLTLRQVYETPANLRVELPHGTRVADLRNIPPENISRHGLLFVQGTTYHYAWTGRLPERAMLPAVGTATAHPFTMVGAPRPTARHSSFPLWQVIAAISLIVVGGFWYWRVRRVERRT